MNNIYIDEKEKGNPKIDPRVAAHDASYLMDISESHFFYYYVCKPFLDYQLRAASIFLSCSFFFFFLLFPLCQSHDFKSIYLTIIPRAEMAIIISYLTSASGIIVLITTPTESR